MIKLFFILILPFFIFIVVQKVYSQTTTQSQIDDFQSKVASKVASLNLVEKRGISGVVTDSSDTQITLNDLNGKTRFVDVDELTKFSSSSKSFGISDITKGSTLGILGLYNKDSRRILAREVSVMTAFPKIVYGSVLETDDKNFEITIIKPNGQKEVAEVEDITKTLSYTNNSLVKSGFSKIETQETVLVIGVKDKQDPNKIVAERIILFPDIHIENLISDVEPTNPPSTGSGIKLYKLK